ncbi:MAG TPA: oxidoreductase [Nocardioidaceae bacterium]|nr:oxidoreductase [Nocardioidaceae bacterium]
MRLLVLGGTSWLGGAVAAEAVDRGWEVTCLARGESGTVPPGATLVPSDRWKPGAYDGLPEFDAAVEVSWQPELVRSALAAVAAAHWVYVSSISVYADSADAASTELLPAWDGTGEAAIESYGGAKVACEEAFAAALDSSRYAVARAGLIGGYGDLSDRLGYWPARIDAVKGGRTDVLVPDPLSGPVQVIDVLDLASWLVHCAEHRVSGTYDAVGPHSSLLEVLDASSAATDTAPRYVVAGQEVLEAAGVRPWSGPESLPLWAPGLEGLMRRDPGPATAQGLVLRPVSDTVIAALRWEREQGQGRPRRSGLSAEREAELLVMLSR